MKKTSFMMIGIILILLIGAMVTLRILGAKEREPNIEVEPIENTRYETLVKALKNSEYFKDSDITANDTKEIATIDGKYDISIKSGYYMMTIRDLKLENPYCEIVDAIEQSLGAKPAASIETCKETLSGSINIGGISADIFDTYKVLTVNSDEPAKLYNIDNSHVEDDVISIDEINYNIRFDDYIITSMSTGFTKEAKMYNVCGHIYNPKKKTGNFTFKIYDTNKEELDSKEFAYSNDTKKYQSFCVEFPMELDTVKYYSIGRD